MIESGTGRQASFFGSYVYDKAVKKEHFLRKVDELVDFSFVDAECSGLYALNTGRPGWSPVLMFKVVFLQFLYDLSDYDIEEALEDRLSFKMFVGPEAEETPPRSFFRQPFSGSLGRRTVQEYLQSDCGTGPAKRNRVG